MKFKFRGKSIGGILTVTPQNVRTFEEEMGHYTATSARVKCMKKVMGYGEHRIVEPDTCVSDMAVFGAEQLFLRSLVKKDEMGVLLLVTDFPDHFLPPASNIIFPVFPVNEERKRCPYTVLQEARWIPSPFDGLRTGTTWSR